MKVKVIFFAVIFTVIFSGCGFRETVRVPGASWLGIGPALDVEIANFHPLSLYIKVVVLGKEVVRLSPGSTAYDRWHIAFGYEELPVMFLQYRDSLYKDFVGVNGTVLWGYEESQGSIYLEVGEGRSRWHSRDNHLPVPLPRGKRWSVDLPTIRFESAIALQFVNCEPYKATVTYADGKQRVFPKQGDYFSDEVFARDDYQYHSIWRGLIRVEWEDERGYIIGRRSYDYSLDASRGGLRGRGPRAYQYFLRFS